MASLLAVLVGISSNKILRQQSSPNKEEDRIKASEDPAVQEEEARLFIILKCRDRLFSFPPITFTDGFQLQVDQLGRSWRDTSLDQQHCCWRRA